MVEDVAHADKEVRHTRAMRPGFTERAELGWEVSKLIIRLNYNNL